MIGDGLFMAQLETVQTILESVDLLDERQRFPDKSQGAASFRELAYHEIYEKAIREFVYDFRLVDQSLLLFVKGGKNEHDGMLGYSFYDAPVSLMTYRDFVISEAIVEEEVDDLDVEVTRWGDHLMPDYEKYIESSTLKTIVTPIRYDYMARDYRSGVHPASHFHFGFESDIRVGVRKILTPIGFVLFIVRQRYPHHWVRLKQMTKFREWCQNVREKLNPVHKNYWASADENELYLH